MEVANNGIIDRQKFIEVEAVKSGVVEVEINSGVNDNCIGRIIFWSIAERAREDHFRVMSIQLW